MHRGLRGIRLNYRLATRVVVERINWLFDSIFGRIKAEGITYGRDLDDMKTNSRRGGKGVYFVDLDGHILELLTRT